MTSRDPPMTIRSDDPGSLSSLTVEIILIEKKSGRPIVSLWENDFEENPLMPSPPQSTEEVHVSRKIH